MNARVVVEADKIRMAMGHRWNSFVEGYVAATKHTMIRALLYEHDVLVDGTHSQANHIQQLFEIDPEAEFFFVDTPPSICKSRAMSTNQSDLVPVIDRMTDQLIDFVGGEHWDDVTEEKLSFVINQVRMMAWEQVISD